MTHRTSTSHQSQKWKQRIGCGRKLHSRQEKVRHSRRIAHRAMMQTRSRTHADIRSRKLHRLGAVVAAFVLLICSVATATSHGASGAVVFPKADNDQHAGAPKAAVEKAPFLAAVQQLGASAESDVKLLAQITSRPAANHRAHSSAKNRDRYQSVAHRHAKVRVTQKTRA
jgi:uncharacterized iron-regulated membrane protein